MKSLGSNFRNHVIIHFILTTIHCYQDEYYITDQSVSPSPPPLFILSPSSSPSSDYFTSSSIPPSYASPSEFPTYSEFFFTLQGTYNSFAQFKSWDISRNGSLSFHFRTTEPNSLVLYSQSEKCCDFIELKLVEGSLRLRFNLTQGTSILSLGRNLHDYQWHHIAIIVNKEGILLKIDGEIGSRNLRSPEYLTEKQMKMDYLFIGGLPHNYSSEFVSIYLPWVFFEPTFRGQIKGLIYTSEEFIALADNLEPIRWHGLRHNTHEPCLEYDPCNHGGTCINTDNGAECDCRSLDYIGNYCDKPKYSPEATFSGQEFIFFNNISKSILSSSDEISLYFKSRQSNGLLFYSGDGHGDYLNLAIRDGGVMLSVKLGSGLTERTVKPARIRFDDNQWHKVLVHRKVREITRATSFCHFSLTIDGVYTERGSIAGTFSLLSSSILYIGGSDHFEHLPGSRVPSNFIGCLRKVEFIGDSMVLDILDLAKSDLHLFQVKGNLVDSCQEVEAADPVTFTTKESFLALPRWEAVKGGSLSLKVRTNEPNGVLMFSAGGSHSGPNTVLGTSIGASHVGLSLPIRPSDFFALELLDGQIYLLLNLGSGSIKVKASSRRIDDSHWHVITLLRTAKSGRVTVDDAAVDFVTPGGSNQLDLDGPLYLGSVGPTAVGRSSFSMGNGIPPELWAGSLKYGYVGCVRDLVLNNQAIDIASIARKQDSGSVKPSCHSIPSHCDNKPCFNDGICNEGWNRFVCDCRATSFTGPVCTKDATTLNFDGDDFMLIDLGETIVTQAEDLNIRFKTTQLSGFLLTASSFTDKSGSHLTVTLENSRIKVTVNLGEGNKVSYIGNDLGDDKWHTLRLQRRGPSLEVKLDSEYSITELTGQLVDLTYSYITLGSPTTDLIKPVGQWTSSSLLVGKEVPNFIGSIQNFVLNDAAYIEMSKQGVDLNFTVTATYGKKGGAVHSPFTFKSRRTYIGLPQLKAYSTMALYFQFKTTLSNGLILFNGGKEADFIAIELVNGHIHYTFNMGDGPRRIKSSTRSPLNDGKWHSVAVGRPSLGQHTLMVDELVSSISNTGPNLHLDLDGLLYLGGLPREMYATLPPLVQSTHGFEGCLASLDLNGETIDPNGSDALIPSTLVARGCASDSTTGLGSGSEVDCAKSNCENKQGNCLSSDTDCLCDDPGSDKCPQSLGSASYQWGPKGGLIMFTFPDKKLDTKIDQLSISFSTESDNAVLFRVDSGSSADYMELQIFDGTVLMVYNLGTKDHDIGQLDVKVNDGRVHVVRFTRTGPNSTLQVDNHNAVRKNPSGSRQLTVFNSHYKVQVGGKLGPGKETGSLEKPFVGIISGLIYNGLRILDLAMDADPRIGVKGDVTLVTSSGSLGRLKPEKSKSKDQLKPEVKGEDTSSTVKEDSLIFSGEGSGGCYDNDDDDCEFTTAKETELDELITPKFVLSSLRPPTWNNELPTPITSSSSLSTSSTSPAPIPLWPPATTSDRPNKPCNTEDCFDFENSIDNDLGQSPPWGSNSGHQLEVTSSYPPFWNEYDRSTYTYTSPPQVTYPKIAVLPPSQYPHRSRLPLPTRPTGTPRINDVPIPRRPDRPLETGNEKPARDKPKLNIGSVSTDNTTLLIGLTALGLIVIVVATPLIFYSYIRYQNDRYYKGHIPVNGNSRSNGTDVKINFTPVTGAPPLLASDADLESRYRAPTESHIIGETGKRAKKKDMREWYV